MKMTHLWKAMIQPAVVLTGILLAATLAGCGGSTVTGDGSTAVTVTIGGGGSAAAPATDSSRPTPRPLAATIPSTVTAIRFTISGPDIDNVVQTFPVTGSTMSVTLQVPNGPARTILVEAIDTDGVFHFRGTTVVDATGVALAVTIDMVVDPSNPALQSWNARSTGTGTLRAVEFGADAFVAVGDGGSILASMDNGATWPRRVSGTLNDFEDVAFGNGVFAALHNQFIALAAGGYYLNQFLTAPAGNLDAWTPRTPFATLQPLHGIAFGNGTFVSVGDNAVYVSTDNGANWTGSFIEGISSLTKVAFGNGRFVAVASSDGLPNDVAVSTDNGQHWALSSINAGTAGMRGVAFGNGTFLAVDWLGGVFTSPDGLVWTSAGSFENLDESIQGVNSGGSVFLVSTSIRILYSVDNGMSWSTGQSGNFTDTVYGNGTFVAVGSPERIDQSNPL